MNKHTTQCVQAVLAARAQAMRAAGAPVRLFKVDIGVKNYGMTWDAAHVPGPTSATKAFITVERDGHSFEVLSVIGKFVNDLGVQTEFTCAGAWFGTAAVDHWFQSFTDLVLSNYAEWIARTQPIREAYRAAVRELDTAEA